MLHGIISLFMYALAFVKTESTIKVNSLLLNNEYLEIKSILFNLANESILNFNNYPILIIRIRLAFFANVFTVN